MRATTTTLPTPRTAPTDHNHDLVHIVCPNAPEQSYCGLDMTHDVLWTPTLGVWPECVVCNDLRDPLFGCPTCAQGGQH